MENDPLRLPCELERGDVAFADGVGNPLEPVSSGTVSENDPLRAPCELERLSVGVEEGPLYKGAVEFEEGTGEPLLGATFVVLNLPLRSP